MAEHSESIIQGNHILPPQVSGMPDPASPSFERSAHDDPGPANRAFYPALDGLRALAFLMVFGFHYIGLFWGWAGVDIFFVLSGFLITGILVDTMDRPHRVWNFYVRRTLRVFPLYYGVFLLILIASPWLHSEWDLSWLVWPAYVGNLVRLFHLGSMTDTSRILANGELLSSTMSSFRLSLGHFWSLCVEEQFYLLWPAVVFLVKDRRRLMYLCFGSVVVTTILRILVRHVLPDSMEAADLLYRVTLFRMDALLLGGLVALILREGKGEALRTIARATFVLCLAMLIMWLAMNPDARELHMRIFPNWAYTWGLTYIDLFAASLMVMALHPGSWTYRLLVPRPLRWLGRISYGAYVFHNIPHAAFDALCRRLHIWSPGRVALVALACTLPTAWLSFRFFESPFIRLKEKLSR